MKSCKDLMTSDPVCCLPDDTVEKVAKLMKKEDVGPIPVIEDKGNKRLIGIVTDRDLVIKVLAEGSDPASTPVKAVMTIDPVTCTPNDEVDVAMDAMAGHQIRRIPVVDADNCLIGIIAQSDIATRTKDKEKKAEVLEEISKP
jgi:CBS domain-containing protein